MKKWFNKQSRLVQIILLLIPGVNWIIEVAVRWSNFEQKKGLFSLLIAVLVTVGGLVFGWIDCLWVILFKHLIFAR